MATYPGLSSKAFRHPLDSQAEQTLRSVPGFELLAKNFVEYFHERPRYVYFMGNYIQVGPRQYSTLYGMFRECVRDLSVSGEPTLFISQDAQVNSYSLGTDHPSIVINTGLVDHLSEAEIRTVIAHELGHVKCGHTVLMQMAVWAMTATQFLGDITLGLGNLLSSGLLFSFYEWRRKAELSADRAALLVMEDLDLVMQTMMKVAGGSQKYAHECSLEEFQQQSHRYLDLDKDELNQFYKFLIYNGGQGAFLSHPFPVERLHYLQGWQQSEQYQQIRQGNYHNVTTEGSVDVESHDTESEVDALKRQIEALQEEIERVRRRSQSDRNS
ncbi:M48 family metalloprotease [Spirulina sp. CS-785/01]|uniref:M48 family metallopeptidase n=1 Tax=Spirulina sp. CS-785/01 TaxID=3021716 RepID=UPI00232CCC58|nr:M48 family metalloprotease [Spirulina sp. CS-785/01]MDB9315482.1 M48 family metalloprotease [Spirulina sp. CS-785/01]